MRRSLPVMVVLVTLFSILRPIMPSSGEIDGPQQSGTPTSTSSALRLAVVTVAKAANLRAGPGTTFAIVGSASTGEELQVVPCADDGQCDWLMLDDGRWIASFLVTPSASDSPSLVDRSQSSPSTPTPASEAERKLIFLTMINELVKRIDTEYDTYYGYVTRNADSPELLQTDLAQSTLSALYARVIDAVTEFRSEAQAYSYPEITEALDAFLDASEDWVLTSEVVHGVNGADVDTITGWLEAITDYEINRDELLTLLSRYGQFPTRTPTPEPTLRTTLPPEVESEQVLSYIAIIQEFIGTIDTEFGIYEEIATKMEANPLLNTDPEMINTLQAMIGRVQNSVDEFRLVEAPAAYSDLAEEAGEYADAAVNWALAVKAVLGRLYLDAETAEQIMLTPSRLIAARSLLSANLDAFRRQFEAMATPVSTQTPYPTQTPLPSKTKTRTGPLGLPPTPTKRP